MKTTSYLADSTTYGARGEKIWTWAKHAFLQISRYIYLFFYEIHIHTCLYSRGLPVWCESGSTPSTHHLSSKARLIPIQTGTCFSMFDDTLPAARAHVPWPHDVSRTSSIALSQAEETQTPSDCKLQAFLLRLSNDDQHLDPGHVTYPGHWFKQLLVPKLPSAAGSPFSPNKEQSCSHLFELPEHSLT